MAGSSTQNLFANPPIVIATYPDALQRDVFINTKLTATFNQAMDSEFFDETTFVLVKNHPDIPNDPNAVVRGLVTYDSGTRTATFAPFNNLEAEEEYLGIIVGNQDPSATFTVGVRSLLGDGMEGSYSWPFRTGSSVTSDPDLAVLASGVTGYEAPEQAPPTGYIKSGELSVLWTEPDYAESNVPVTTSVVVQFNDNLAVEFESALGQMTLGDSYLNSLSGVIGAYVSVENRNVLGFPYTSERPWIYNSSWDSVNRRLTLTSDPSTEAVDGYFNTAGIWASGNLLTGVLEENNEYTITIRSGLEGRETTPLYIDSHPRGDFVTFFTTAFDPLFTTAEIIRLNLGAFIRNVPDNTINLIIHENSIEAQRRFPLGILDPRNLPWYVFQWVVCKSKLDVLNATQLGWAGSAGGRKRLADLEIEHSTLARDMDLILKPKRDELVECIREMEVLLDSGGRPPRPDWAVIGKYQPRRPIENRSWRRLPKIEPVGPYGRFGWK